MVKNEPKPNFSRGIRDLSYCTNITVRARAMHTCVGKKFVGRFACKELNRRPCDPPPHCMLDHRAGLCSYDM